MQNNVNKNANRKNINQNQPDAAALNKLLGIAAGKLGTDPNTLMKKLQSGELEQSLKNSPPANKSMEQLQKALNDPNAMNKLMNDPKTRELINKFSKG